MKALSVCYIAPLSGYAPGVCIEAGKTTRRHLAKWQLWAGMPLETGALPIGRRFRYRRNLMAQRQKRQLEVPTNRQEIRVKAKLDQIAMRSAQIKGEG